MTREQELWDERLSRLAKLSALKAPRVIIVHSCLIQLSHYGMSKALWFWFKSHYWIPFKFKWWLWWQRDVAGMSHEEIEKKIMEEQ